MKASELIDQYLGELWPTPRKGFVTKPEAKVTKSDYLSGSEVASLNTKQHIVVNGKRGVVLDVNIKGNSVELIYSKGVKSFSRDKYLTVRKTDAKTPVQYFTKTYVGEDCAEDLIEKFTKGLKKAYSKQENAAKVCKACGLTAPKYPGRYPQHCPECGEQMEDLQNSPRYSEGNGVVTSDYNKAWQQQSRVVSKKTRIGRE